MFLRQGLRSVGSSLARQSIKHKQALPMAAQQVRHLNLHEYQSKGLMAKHDVRVQKGDTADSTEEAFAVAQRIKNEGANDLILKAQILAGGRGKGHFDTGFKGGVKIVTTPEEVRDNASQMFGNWLVTNQTGPEGQQVNRVLIHEGVDFDKEFYFAILLDRDHNGPVMVGSPMGGMDIEAVAEDHPEAIFTMPIDIDEGLTDESGLAMAKNLGFEGKEAIIDAKEQMQKMYQMFLKTDALQLEINPLIQTRATDADPSGKVYCVDAKLEFDTNAMFRQQDIFDQRDVSMDDPREIEAEKHQLNYIGLDGNIGCMVNGAGLAMATMDIIKLHGGTPANFLDVGGGATAETVEEAFKILTADPKVKALLVNIFGGIMKCDIIAEGVVEAAKKVGLKMPLIVRLEGTNVERGKQILAESGLDIVSADDLDDAAKKAVLAL